MENCFVQRATPTKVFRLDPRTKIWLTFTLTTILISSDRVGIMRIIQPCLAAVPFIFLMLSKRPRIAFAYLCAYALALLIPTSFILSSKSILKHLMIAVVGLSTRLLPGMLMGYVLITTTTVSEFTAAMDRMHMTKKITVPLSVMFRFLPTIREEYGFIKDAMRMREILSARNPISMLEYRFVPLLMSVVSIGGEMSASALSRGLGAPVKRTNVCKIGFKWPDILLMSGCVLCLCLFVLSLVNVI